MKKEICLLGSYFAIFEEGKENAICKLCSSMTQATKFVSLWQNKFQKKFFIKKLYSWDFKAKNLMYIIDTVGTKSLKKQLNEKNEENIFKI